MWSNIDRRLALLKIQRQFFKIQRKNEVARFSSFFLYSQIYINQVRGSANLYQIFCFFEIPYWPLLLPTFSLLAQAALRASPEVAFALAIVITNFRFFGPGGLRAPCVLVCSLVIVITIVQSFSFFSPYFAFDPLRGNSRM